MLGISVGESRAQLPLTPAARQLAVAMFEGNVPGDRLNCSVSRPKPVRFPSSHVLLNAAPIYPFSRRLRVESRLPAGVSLFTDETSALRRCPLGRFQRGSAERNISDG
jgi:hypothetical protein